jgi:hypothetical protein
MKTLKKQRYRAKAKAKANYPGQEETTCRLDRRGAMQFIMYAYDVLGGKERKGKERKGKERKGK